MAFVGRKLTSSLILRISSTLLLEAASISTISVNEPFNAPLQISHSLHGSPSFGFKQFIALANILADVISPLIEIVDQFLAEDGVFVISGIIDTKEKEIADKLNAYGFDVIETRRMKDWVSMTAKMR